MEKYLGPGESVWERLSGAEQKGPNQKSSLGYCPLRGSRPGPLSPWYPGYVESQVNMSQKKCEYFTDQPDQPEYSCVDGEKLKFNKRRGKLTLPDLVVQPMGPHLQGPHDHHRGHLPAGASCGVCIINDRRAILSG
jgi:hypothetical protein